MRITWAGTAVLSVLAALAVGRMAWAAATTQSAGPAGVVSTQAETFSPSPSHLPFAPIQPIPRQDIGPKQNYFAADEWAALARIVDRTDDANNTADDGLPILLQRVGCIEWRDVIRVTVSDLLARPAAYRGRPIKLVFRYAENTLYNPAKRAWAGDLIRSLGFCAVEGGGPDQPILIINRGQLCDRSQGQPWEVVGYFYRIQRTAVRGSDKMIDVPVIVAGTWNEGLPVTAWYDTIFFWTTVGLSVVAAGCVVWRRRAAVKRLAVGQNRKGDLESPVTRSPSGRG